MLGVKCISGLIIIFLLTVTGSVFAQVPTNQDAPDFTLSDTNGQKHTLFDYKGSIVVLEWFNPDCSSVERHYDNGDIPGLQQRYTAKGVVWFLIAPPGAGQKDGYTPQSFNNFKGGSPTAVLLDTDGSVGHLYNAQTTPSMYVIDPKGVLIYQGAIDDTPNPDIGNLKTVQNYVSAAIDATMNGTPVMMDTTKSYGCSVQN